MTRLLTILLLAALLLTACASPNPPLGNETTEAPTNAESTTPDDTATIQNIAQSSKVEVSDTEQPSIGDSDTEQPNNQGEINQMSNCYLIVNGKDVSSSCYVKMDTEIYGVEISLTAVMEELGAIVEWKDDGVVEITYNKNMASFDTKDSLFSVLIPPGEDHAVRRIIGKDLIFDIYSVKQYIEIFANVTLKIDYDNRTVTIFNQ